MIGLAPEENRAFSAGAFWMRFSPGAMPQALHEVAPLALRQIFLCSPTRRFAWQSVNQACLHHVNCDLGNLVLTQLGPHFVLQTRWVHPIWEVQEKYHLPFVLEK